MHSWGVVSFKNGNPFLLHLIFLIVFYNKKCISALYCTYPAATYGTMPVPCLFFLFCTLGGIASWWQNSFSAYHAQVMKVCHYRYHYRGTYQGELEKTLKNDFLRKYGTSTLTKHFMLRYLFFDRELIIGRIVCIYKIEKIPAWMSYLTLKVICRFGTLGSILRFPYIPGTGILLKLYCCPIQYDVVCRQIEQYDSARIQ